MIPIQKIAGSTPVGRAIKIQREHVFSFCFIILIEGFVYEEVIMHFDDCINVLWLYQ